MQDYAKARQHMVDSQLRTNKLTDARLIEAFATVPRESFVPPAVRAIAYVDEDLPFGDGRFLLEPMVLARLLQTAAPRAADVALIIGPATGYAAAILSHVVSTVVAVDPDKPSADAVSGQLSTMGIDNVVMVEGALNDGYPQQAPYDIIVIEGSVAEVPRALLDQLGEGGRLVTVVRDGDKPSGHAVLYERVSGIVGHTVVFDANVPRLSEFNREPGFVF